MASDAWSGHDDRHSRSGNWGNKDDYGSEKRSRNSGPGRSLFVNRSVVGRIIGRGGSTIQDLQRESGAGINVSRERDGSTVEVTLSGDEENMTKAEAMINELISGARGDSFRGRDNGVNGGGSSGWSSGNDGWQSQSVANGGHSGGGWSSNRPASNSVGRGSGGGWTPASDERQPVGGGWNAGGAETSADGWNSGGQSSGGGWGTENGNDSKPGDWNPESGSGGSWGANTGGGGWTGGSGYNSGGGSFGGGRGRGRGGGWNHSGGGSQAQGGGSWNPVEGGGSVSSNPSGAGPIDWGAAIRESAKMEAERWAQLVDIKKDYYVEVPQVAMMTPDDVEKFRMSKNDLKVLNLDKTKNSVINNPVVTFEHAFHGYPDILREIQRQNFIEPSPIQCQAWPILLSGRDCVAIAQTGTGKTLAFLLPAFIHIEGQLTPRQERHGPTVLCMCPTRELALQIAGEVSKYSYHGITSVCLYGGGSRREQIDSVSRGVEIVIATPGRLNDLVAARSLDLSSVTYLILDEADRMLDMGFEPQIRKILLDIRPDRQTVMTSATWPRDVQAIADRYMNDPCQVFVGTLDLTSTKSVTQHLEIMLEEDKKERLWHFLTCQISPEDKVLIFVGRKDTVDVLASDYALRNFSTQSIHGGREQCDRENALQEFKDGVTRVLIATDVASRGIDVPDVTFVINFDFPGNVEEYVHRVGRTGRAGKTGQSVTFMTRRDWNYAPELIEILERAEQYIPDELREMARRFEQARREGRIDNRGRRGGPRGRGRGGGGRGVGFGGGGGRRGGFTSFD